MFSRHGAEWVIDTWDGAEVGIFDSMRIMGGCFVNRILVSDLKKRGMDELGDDII